MVAAFQIPPAVFVQVIVAERPVVMPRTVMPSRKPAHRVV